MYVCIQGSHQGQLLWLEELRMRTIMATAFENISLRGRMAYVIMCAERYALTKKPNAEWRPVFKDLWSITEDIMWDDWSDRVMDLLPEFIYELEAYDPDEFSWLDKEDFVQLKELYDGMGDAWATIIRNLVDMEEIYAYTSIPGTGSESIALAEEAIKLVRDCGIDAPDVDQVAFSSFGENNGRGDPFDAKPLSLIL